MVTKVIFRKWSNGDVIAIFPQFGFKYNHTVTCYEHIGQHGEGDYLHLLCKTKLAKPEEYADLLEELKRRGYENIRVCKRARVEYN